MKSLLKSIIALILILSSSHAFAADYWTANVSRGTGDGSSAENARGWSTANVANLMGGTLTTNNRVFVCGTLTATSTWNPGGVSGSTGYVEINGDPDLSGCDAGGWDQSSSGTTLVAIGGGSRQNIRLTDLFFKNCATHCVIADGTNIVIASSTFNTAKDSGVKIGTQTANGIYVQGNTFTNVGNSTSSAQSAVNVQPADGVTVNNVQIKDNTITGNGVGRYGVNIYATGASLDNGTSTNAIVRGNRFGGRFFHSAVNVSNNATGTIIEGNDFLNVLSSGGVVIHNGGQGATNGDPSVANCVKKTTGSIIRFNRNVQGGVFNVGNPADASGIMADECSFATQIYGNDIYGNQHSGIYLNDATTSLIYSNTIWGNDINCINVHGTSTANLFYNNSCYHYGSDNHGISTNGFDGIQVDVNSPNNTFKNNLVIGNSTAKGIDIDAATSTVQRNLVYGFTTTVEGPADSQLITARPQIRNIPVKSSQDFRLLNRSNIYATGTSLGRFVDAGNRLFNNRPSIGAWEYGDMDFSATRTIATGQAKFNGATAREFVDGSNSINYNIVKNLMNGDASALSNQHIPSTTGCTFTDTGSSTVITATSTGNARCFLFQTVTSVVSPDKMYVFGGEFSNVVGTFTVADISISGSVDAGPGSLKKTTNGRFALPFSPAPGAGTELRIGIGVGANEALVAGDSITVSNTYLYEIPTPLTPPNEFVWKNAVLPYANTNATSSGEVFARATTSRYAFPSKRANSVLIIGDSFCNNSTDYAEQLKSVSNRAIYYNCVFGADFADAVTNYTNWLANPTLEKTHHQMPKTVIFGGAINDIQSDKSLATMQDEVMTLVRMARENQMIPVILGPTPFGTASSWTAPRQSVLDSFRSWMRASSTEFMSVDPYTAFLHATTSNALAQGGLFGNSGDGLHPVSGGMKLLALYIDRMALQVIDKLSN